MEPTRMEADVMAALGKLGMEQHFLPKACSPQDPTFSTQPPLPKRPPKLQASNLRVFRSLQALLYHPSQPSIFWKALFPQGPTLRGSSTSKGSVSQCPHCRCGIKLSGPLPGKIS